MPIVFNVFRVLLFQSLKVFFWIFAYTGVDFINILGTTFTPVAPQSVRTQVKLSVSFYAFGIYERKGCTRTLMKLSPGFSLYLNEYGFIKCFAILVFHEIRIPIIETYNRSDYNNQTLTIKTKDHYLMKASLI